MEGMVVEMTGSSITVGAAIFSLDFNLQTGPLVTLFYLNMSDQTNAAIVSIDTKDQSKLFSSKSFLLQSKHICLNYILYITMPPHPSPPPRIPYIVQLGKTLTLFVTNEL